MAKEKTAKKDAAPVATEAEMKELKRLTADSDAKKVLAKDADKALAEYEREIHGKAKAKINADFAEKQAALREEKRKAMVDAGVTGGSGSRGPSARCPILVRGEMDDGRLVVTILDRNSKESIEQHRIDPTKAAINSLVKDVASRMKAQYPGPWTGGQVAGWGVVLREKAGLYKRNKK